MNALPQHLFKEAPKSVECTEHSVWCLQGSSTQLNSTGPHRRGIDLSAWVCMILRRAPGSPWSGAQLQNLAKRTKAIWRTEDGSRSFAALFRRSAQLHPFVNSLAWRNSQSSHISNRPDDLGRIWTCLACRWSTLLSYKVLFTIIRRLH